MNPADLVAHMAERPPPALHYGRDDPKTLGHDLAKIAHMSFDAGPRAATYDCNGQWFRYRAGGVPFEVIVTAFTPKGEKKLFRLINNGDGLAFEFGRAGSLPPKAKIVLQGVREEAALFRHNI